MQIIFKVRGKEGNYLKIMLNHPWETINKAYIPKKQSNDRGKQK